MRYMYAKIPLKEAERLTLSEYRKKTPDGDYVIVNESDLQTCGDDATFSEKVKALGGAVLTAIGARNELNR